uniref:Secreted protein n=1 Tax=uncultured bacterium esnapd14 TaxID=1366594 RepID=S5TMV1_9BACT|nr:hypothetical protein [uncultured bacterium esnapd14]
MNRHTKSTRPAVSARKILVGLLASLTAGGLTLAGPASPAVAANAHTAVVALGLATGGPAVAAEPGNWHAYGNTNPITSSPSTWRCTPTQTVAPEVVAQACAVRSANGDAVQGAVIVRNNYPYRFAAWAAMDLYNLFEKHLGSWGCSTSNVAANSWSVCFGRTFRQIDPVKTFGVTNNAILGRSPLV